MYGTELTNYLIPENNNRNIYIHSKSYTYTELRQSVADKVIEFNKKGIKRGSVILFVGPKNFDLICSIYACLEIGAVGAICEFEDLYLVCEQLEKFNFIIKTRGLSLKNFIPSDSDSLYISLNTKKTLTEEIKWLFFTSGSMGQRKMIGINEQNIKDRIADDVDLFSISIDTRALHFLSLSHELGWYYLLSLIKSGAKIYISNLLSAGHAYNEITNNMITQFVGVPKFWKMLSLNDLLKKTLKLASLEVVTLSGGGLSKAELVEISSYLINAKLILTYGQTETSRTLYSIVERGTKNFSFKHSVEGVKIEFDKGELIHSGKGVMYGKFDFGEIKKESKVYTGDLFELKEGEYIFLGRRDRVIKLHDHRVSLDEIESLLIQNLKVIHCVILEKNNGLHLFYTNDFDVKVEEVKRLLPKYVNISSIMRVENIPYNKAGKIDYLKLGGLNGKN